MQQITSTRSMVQMFSVNSTMLGSLGFSTKGNLHVSYKSSPDLIYVYHKVPMGIFVSLLQTSARGESVGALFKQTVRGNFTSTKVKVR